MDVSAEVDRLFDDSSIPADDQPVAVIIWGGVAAGKTTLRKQKYSSGYVLIDAADIYRSLCRAEFVSFPGPFEDAIETIGRTAAERALSEGRNIVTEIIGCYDDYLLHLSRSLRSIGYRVEGICITCDVEEAVRRHESRNKDNISAYNAEGFQFGWIVNACRRLAGEGETVAESERDLGR